MLFTVMVGTTAALLAWRERPEPGATALSVMLGGQVWWSVFYIFELEAATLASKFLWTNVQWLGVVVIPLAWLLFALAYTGNDRYLTRRNVLLLSTIPAITVVLAATHSFHTPLYTDARLVGSGESARLAVEGGIWFWVIAGYTYLLGLLGSIPLIRFVFDEALAFRGQSLALLVGTLVPWASNVLFLTGSVPIVGFDPTPVAFSVSGVAYLSALTQFRLFGTSPAPNRRARHLVFERLHDGAVVIDSHGYIVDLNDSAASILSTSYREAVGTPADELIPSYEHLPHSGTMDGHLTIGDEHGTHPYDVTATEITDFRGRNLGRVITFHDIGNYLRQQQRLEVLNRVLRHNIRTETSIIQGYAELLETPETAETVGTIKKHTGEIVEMSDKSRMITEMFNEKHTKPIRLDPIITDCLQSLKPSHPDVTFRYTSVETTIVVDGVLESVIENVIENAAEHNTNRDPVVRISVDTEAVTSENWLQITVSDNGPGIDEYEQSVIAEGTETPLDHGSGLGLWLIVWGTELAGGHVTFDGNEPSGCVVTIRVPYRSETDRIAARED